MIRYALKCADGHDFESWFQSSAAYDRLAAAGALSCPVCGGAEVRKGLMAPSVTAAPARGAPAAEAPEAGAEAPGPLSTPATPAEAALRELRRRLEANAENVGRRFAAEARAIHAGEADERQIYGEATAQEARELLDDGVPVAPLPFPLRRDG